MAYPNSIKNLIECYKKLPGIGEKTAERLALASMNLDDNIIKLFSESLCDVKTKIKRCKKCYNLTENNLCDICNDPTRDHKTICVVEEAKNVILFEKVGTYKGLYHVLDGLISPVNGKTPENLNITSLVKRISDENIKEVIIAVKPSIEGETTALYLLKILQGSCVTVSKIAYGIPLGADIDYIDPLTLELALEDRKRISE